LILRRISGEPVQYVVRRAWFRDLILEVGPGVLIPRPETEGLAGEVITWLEGRSGPAQVLDVGTGSGAIALAVAAERPGAQVVGADISPQALQFARRNRARVEARSPGTASRVALVAADGFGAFRGGFDVVVSNPPYISEADAGTLPQEVRGHEPPVALFAADRGLSMIERLIREAPDHLAPGGLLALEVGDGQAPDVRERVASAGAYDDARVVKDLAGRERVVLAERS
jgi:release factor glutamine methyltransferase